MRKQDPILTILETGAAALSITNNTDREKLLDVLEIVESMGNTLYITHSMDSEMTHWFNENIPETIDVQESNDISFYIRETIYETYFDNILNDVTEILNSDTDEETVDFAYDVILCNEEFLQSIGLVFTNYDKAIVIDEFLCPEQCDDECEECCCCDEDEIRAAELEEELSEILEYTHEKFYELLEYKDDSQTRLLQSLVATIYDTLNPDYD